LTSDDDPSLGGLYHQDFDVDDAVRKLAILNILKRTRLGAGATAGEGGEMLQVRWLLPSHCA